MPWACGRTCRSHNGGAGIGPTRRRPSEPFTRIAGGFAGTAAKPCGGNAANSWTGRSPIRTTPAACGAHLRSHENILKRVLAHAGAFTLGLVMRALIEVGTPRGLQGRVAALLATLATWVLALGAFRQPQGGPIALSAVAGHHHNVLPWPRAWCSETGSYSTIC